VIVVAALVVSEELAVVAAVAAVAAELAVVAFDILCYRFSEDIVVARILELFA